MSFRVAVMSGVPVRVHVSSAITFVVLSYVIGFGFVGHVDASLSPVSALLLGAAAALLLFASLIVHEYGHVLCARRFGVEARSVDLHFLGGEAKLTCDAASWRQEFCIALSGPLASLILALVLGLAVRALEPGSALSIITFYLAFANAVLAAANLVPAYPLDGGRIAHAALWGLLGDRLKSARFTAVLGQGIGLAAAVGGSYLLFTAGIDGVLLVALGWYLYNTAAQSRADEEGYVRLRQSGIAPNCSA